MSMNTEYFVIKRGGGSDYPLLAWDDDEDFYRPLAKSAARGHPVTEPAFIKLRLGAPVPTHPIMVDYHSLPEPVVGERIKNVLEPLHIGGTQLIPARIPVGDEVYDYRLLHVFNRIVCVDKEQSNCTYSRSGRMIDIKHLALDEDILGDLPLERRLIFVLAESTSTYLFHQSIKDAVMAIEPKGVQFFRADQWGSAAVFGS